MSLFAHYPASPDVVLTKGDTLLSAAPGVEGVGSSVAGLTSVAGTQTDGLIQAPVLSLDRPVTTDARSISSASLVAGGALGLFSGAIRTYNDGVDELNRIYEEAKAADFYADPVGDDATGADGEPLSSEQKQSEFDGRVAGARSVLESLLGFREASLMRDLDDAADGTATLLDAGVDPTSTVSLAAMNVFGFFGGSGDDDDDDDDDDGGGFLDGVGGAFSDATGAFSDGLSTVQGVVSEGGQEVWDRGSTFVQYGGDTALRRLSNPGQTFWDTMTGTTIVEDLSAAEGILVEDGELYRDGEYCGSDAACLTGVSTPDGADALTTGHTVRFNDEGVPEEDLVAHEMQHVYDIEDLGTAGFYGSYLAEYLARRAGGESHQDAYENITWERRAYDVQDDYPQRKPQGILSELYDKVFG